MDFVERRLPGDTRPVVVSGVTLGTFVVFGSFVAFAEWGIFPREALLVGAPAIAAALVIDTVLSNEFLIRAGDAIWLFVYAFLYLEAVLVGFWMRWWRRQSERPTRLPE